MSKSDNLRDYLADLYEGIASKKPNASRNPQDFRREIEGIESGGGSGGGTGKLITKTIRNNGEYNAFTDNADGFSLVVVDVGDPSTEEVEFTPDEYGAVIKPTKAEYLSKVKVLPIPNTYVKPSGQKTITSNGTYSVAGKERVVVAVTGTSESPIPTDIASADELSTLLAAATPEDNGRIYRYVGESGTYVKNAYYKIGVRVDG